MKSTKSNNKSPAAKRRKFGASSSSSAGALVSQEQERSFVVNLIDEFLRVIGESCATISPSDLHDKFSYLAIFVAFITDLLSQMTTRRFLHVVLRRRHFLMNVRRSALVQYCLQWSDASERSSLKAQLSMLEAVLVCPVDAHTGKSLSHQDVRERSSQHIQALQQHAFQSFRSTRLEALAILPVSFIADRSTFAGHLSELVASDNANVHKFASQLGVISDEEAMSQDDLIECFLEEYSSSSAVKWQDVPISLTELDIWSNTLGNKSTADECVYGATGLLAVLPIRKLGLQFLNLSDCLQRNYDLVRLEAADVARSTLENSIKQLDAVRSLVSAENQTIFRGFSPLATPLEGALKIQKVSKPLLGESAPATVLAEFEVELNEKRQDSKSFDKFHPNEIVYLVSIHATNDEAAEVMGFTKEKLDLNDQSGKNNFAEAYGVLFVRTAHIVEVLDTHGTIINDENPTGKGRRRTVKVGLDGRQYKKDLATNQMDAYKFVNVMIRKYSVGSNLEAQLEAVMDTWRTSESEPLLPSWLHDVIVGYGDPFAASYQSIYKHIKHQQEVSIPLFHDSVVDAEHAVEMFSTPDATPALVDAENPTSKISAKNAVGPFTYTENLDDPSKRAIHAYHRPETVADQVENSTVRFTRSQAAALRSGLCECLTVVSGAPQTGKTEVVIQLVANLCRQEPTRQKILVVAHSNLTLDTFVKEIVKRNKISEATIVRLGPSQEGSDFNCSGRVNFLLYRRTIVLQEVALMAQWIESKDPTHTGLSSSVAYSCDNALFFYKMHAKAILDTVGSQDETVMKEYFTVRRGSEPSAEDLQSFAASMHQFFFELKRIQQFELLQTAKQRGDMFLMDQARVITMTCADVAMNRDKLIHLGLHFSTLIMEDASEALEIDTLLPLLMASSATNSNNLKRVVLMGDPAKQPAFNSQALKSYAHLNQSLFARLIRLGVPAIELKARSDLNPSK